MRPVVGLVTAVFLLLAAAVAGAESDPPRGDDTDAVRRRVAELIEQLRAPKYIVRQTARQELRERGLAAFDQLMLATEDPDPEVAATSRRLLQTMTIRWTRPGDPPSVARVLDVYGGFDEDRRRTVVAGLASRHGMPGLAALCRVARFDAFDRVSREAALAAIEASGFEVSPDRVEAVRRAEDELTNDFGPSRRPAGVWLRLFAQQARDPAAVYEAWRVAIEQEAGRVAERQPYTDERLLTRLRWNWLRVQLAAGRHERLLETIDRLDTEPGESALSKALEWMIDAGADRGIDELIADRDDRLKSKRGRYLIAVVRGKQGRADESERAAEEAFAFDPDPADDRRLEGELAIDGRVIAGQRLERRGHAEWAWREYRRAADETPDLSINAVYARQLLTDSLYDHERHRDAAAVLTRALDAITSDEKSRVRYDDLARRVNRPGAAPLLRPVALLTARRDFCLALAAKGAGDLRAELEHLDAAIDQSPEDADILIAMYRAGGADEAYREATRGRIRELAAAVQRRIDASPDDPAGYNEWAWLISNTEGDYAKAVRYSQRSLQLEGGRNEPGFLDTLGRCYYALGDLEQAVAAQRRAVAGRPYMMVMQRQLELFEEELDKAN